MPVGLVTGFTQTKSKPGLLVTINGGTAVISGSVASFSVGDISVGANTTTYIYLNFSSGLIESSTSGFLAGAWPIAIAVSNRTDVVSLTDSRPDVFAGSGSTINFADAEVPSGTINGVNVTFTLAHIPNPAASLQLFNGLIQKAGGTDYTLSGLTITFVTAPTGGSTLVAFYRY